MATDQKEEDYDMTTDAIELKLPIDAAAALQAKMKLAFADLITDEAWAQMITAEWETFTKAQRKNTGSPNYPQWVETPSGFSVIAREVLKEVAHDHCLEHFSTKETRERLEACFEAEMKVLGPKMATDFVDKLIMSMVYDMTNALAANVRESIRSAFQMRDTNHGQVY